MHHAPRPLLVVLALAACAALATPPPAEACAILPADSAAPPNLAVERVLILHDAERRLEHFVREVRFDGAAGTFAFVVPTPTRPEVEAVQRAPFDALAEAFPIDPPPQAPDPDSKSAGMAVASAPEAVQVLSVQQVGKFTAFVLAANDAAGLEKWLGDNRITVPAGGRAWLGHYVALNHFFTAFRYDAPPPGAPASASQPPALPGADAAAAPSGGFATPPPSAAPAPPVPLGPDLAAPATMTSETVRLTFAAATPYFPYLEPAHAAAAASSAPHEMQVWLVSRERRAPRLRRFVTGQAPRWAWPWQAGMTYDKEATVVRAALGELGALAPQDGALMVQTFRDPRTNRDGWGDIVFPVEEADLSDPAVTAPLTPVLGDLSSLIHAGALEPDELAAEERFRVAPGSGACGCTLPGSGGAAGGLAAAAMAALAVAVLRRRRAR